MLDLSLQIEQLYQTIILEITKIQTCMMFAGMLFMMLIMFLGYLLIARQLVKDMNRKEK